MGTRIRHAAFFGLIAAAAFALLGRPAAAGGFGSVQLNWKIVPVVKLALTPNYASGFGPQGGVGSGSTPAPGSGAVLDGGVVDFGNQVVQGYSYLYKYAVQAAVQTNDSNGFTLFAEGSSNVIDTTSGATYPLNQLLFWLPSSAANSPFSSATPFQVTSGTPGCAGACITYSGNPPPTASVWSYPSSTLSLPGSAATQGFDYQLRLFSSPPTDSFYVYIVYTAVGN